MVENTGCKMNRDMRDVYDLFAFATDGKRPQSEISGFINSLAHQKYPFVKNQCGHDLRMRYKTWLRHRLKRMLRKHYSLRKAEPINLNNSKV